MTTLAEPTVAEVATALLVVAKNQREYDQAALELLAWGLLPNTPPARGARRILRISGYLERAQTYARCTPGNAAEMLGGVTGLPDAVLAEWVQERAKVWRGEAETTALRVAMQDREVEA